MKTVFNDNRPTPALWTLMCPDCRCTLWLEIDHYPHGPNEPKGCPVCQQTHTVWRKER